MNLKKFGLTALFAVLGTSAFGASIDHIQNYTAEYNANMAQQAAISPTTSAYYNPAGIMRLENGTYFTGGVQIAVGKETMKYNTTGNNKFAGASSNKYDADLLAPIPNFAMIKKQDDRAFFWTFGGIAGGGDLEYKDGVAGIKVLEDALNTYPNISLGNIGPIQLHPVDKGSWAEGENMYAQTTIGTAWNINNKLSMSVAGRVVYGWRNLDAKLNAYSSTLEEISKSPLGQNLGIKNGNIHASMESERTAWGFGGQIGLNYAANDTWNFAMRYDTKIKLEFEADATVKNYNLLGKDLGFGNFFPQYLDGAKHRRDLPAILALGASQKVTDKWTMFYGANYYFNESAKIDKDVEYKNLVTGKTETGMEYDNGWEISVGTEYWLNNKWAVLAGVNYADTGAPKDSYSDVEFALNSFLVGMGVKYRPDEDTEWVVSTSHYFYEAADGNFKEKYDGKANAQRYDKNISSIGFSYTKKF